MTVQQLQSDDERARVAARLASALRGAGNTGSLAVVRIRCHVTRAGTRFHSVTGWTLGHFPIVMTVEQQTAVALLMFNRRTDIDWRNDHDYHLDTAMLRQAPAPGRLGSDPTKHRAFGGSDPVFWTGPGHWHDTPAAPAGATASTATWDRGPVSVPAQRTPTGASS